MSLCLMSTTAVLAGWAVVPLVRHTTAAAAACPALALLVYPVLAPGQAVPVVAGQVSLDACRQAHSKG
jgi:hypothetical protein